MENSEEVRTETLVQIEARAQIANEQLARIEEKIDAVVAFVNELQGTLKQVSKSPFLAPMLGR